jgi:hypothetical protein
MLLAVKHINKILYTTSTKNALSLTLNSGFNRGWGSQLNSYIIIAIGHKQSPSIVVIWILILL